MQLLLVSPCSKHVGCNSRKAFHLSRNPTFPIWKWMETNGFPNGFANKKRLAGAFPHQWPETNHGVRGLALDPLSVGVFPSDQGITEGLGRLATWRNGTSPTPMCPHVVLHYGISQLTTICFMIYMFFTPVLCINVVICSILT